MPLTEVQPVKTRTFSEEVAERLREAIRNGSLGAGSRLVEQEVAEQLGVSRVPVREAIQMLVEEGMVRKAPHRGAYVYLPTAYEIEEISSLRVVLECFVVERVIQNWNRAHEERLRSIVAAMRAGMQGGDPQRIYEQDYAFHYALWEIAHHSLLLEVVSGLRSRLSRFLYEANSALSQEGASRHVDSHDEFIDVLKSGDVATAQREIAIHILSAKTRILTHCQLAPVQSPAPPPTGPVAAESVR
jgi:DNA-binding GntR family transcriptional regulator